MKTVWVFGATRSIGKELVERLLARDEKVVAFSRSQAALTHAHFTHHCLDLADTARTRAIVKLCLQEAAPDAVVFCQRYRPDKGIADIDALKRGIDVEIAPAVALVEELDICAHMRPVSLVLITSVAGLFAHPDLGLAYHLAKSNTVALCRYLSSRPSQRNVAANCIVLGEFLKYPWESYTADEQAKFGALQTISPSGKIPPMADVLAAIDLFIAADVQCIRGQVMAVDGGMSILAQEAIVRGMVRQPIDRSQP